jgi:hypothetical protein
MRYPFGRKRRPVVGRRSGARRRIFFVQRPRAERVVMAFPLLAAAIRLNKARILHTVQHKLTGISAMRDLSAALCLDACLRCFKEVPSPEADLLGTSPLGTKKNTGGRPRGPGSV